MDWQGLCGNAWKEFLQHADDGIEQMIDAFDCVYYTPLRGFDDAKLDRHIISMPNRIMYADAYFMVSDGLYCLCMRSCEISLSKDYLSAKYALCIHVLQKNEFAAWSLVDSFPPEPYQSSYDVWSLKHDRGTRNKFFEFCKLFHRRRRNNHNGTTRKYQYLAPEVRCLIFKSLRQTFVGDAEALSRHLCILLPVPEVDAGHRPQHYAVEYLRSVYACVKRVCVRVFSL